MSARTFVMGDIHGNYRAMKQCLERCNFDRTKDTLIQLGDVCDRRDETVKVIETLLSIPSLIAIRGNHDPWLAYWLEHNGMKPGWAENGGIPSVQSYIDAGDTIDRSKHLLFLNEIQKSFYIDDQNRVFVHAGYTHPMGPKFEEPLTNCYWDRSLWSDAMAGLKISRAPDRTLAFKEVFIGHTPTTNWELMIPMQAFNVWNVDTGAGWNGKLTIMDIETKAYWQSDPASELY